MQLATAGAARMGGFNAISSIEFSKDNIITSDTFFPPHKSLLQKLWEFLNRSVQP